MRLLKPLLPQSPPRHLHDVPPVDTIRAWWVAKHEANDLKDRDDGGHRRQLRWCLIKTLMRGENWSIALHPSDHKTQIYIYTKKVG